MTYKYWFLWPSDCLLSFPTLPWVGSVFSIAFFSRELNAFIPYYEYKAANECLHTKMGLNFEFIHTFSVARNGSRNGFVPSIVEHRICLPISCSAKWIALTFSISNTFCWRGSSLAKNNMYDATASIAATSPYRVDRHEHFFGLFGV